MSKKFLHDKAPCFKTLATHELLQQSGIDFFNNSEWPGSSPDLNPAEYLGAIIKDSVEDRMLNEEGRGRCSHQTLLSNLQTVLHDLEHDSELFAELQLSFRHRLDAVVAAAGGHTDY